MPPGLWRASSRRWASVISAKGSSIGSIAGGYGGARLARHIGRDAARRAVVAIGVLVAVLLFARNLLIH